MRSTEAAAVEGKAASSSLVNRMLNRERWLAPLMIAPAVIYVLALVGFPFVLAVLYSFSSISVGSVTLKLVGLRNYHSVIQNPAFWSSLVNTFIFAFVSQILVLVLAKVLALALMKRFRGRWLVRLLILLPFVAPISLGSIGWLWILDSIYSVINWTLQHLGIIGPDTWPIYLGQPRLAMASIITVHVWRLLPLATVIIMAGLSSIPQDLHDAADIDGAGYWRHLFQLTIPLMLPIMLVALLFGIVFTFTDMIVIFVLTRGGPFDSTQVLASLAYYSGIEGGDLAEGAAISLFLFPLLLIVAVAMLRVARKAEVV
jgi:multiple sugar transport system permease protein